MDWPLVKFSNLTLTSPTWASEEVFCEAKFASLASAFEIDWPSSSSSVLVVRILEASSLRLPVASVFARMPSSFSLLAATLADFASATSLYPALAFCWAPSAAVSFSTSAFTAEISAGRASRTPFAVWRRAWFFTKRSFFVEASEMVVSYCALFLRAMKAERARTIAVRIPKTLAMGFCSKL